jgi:hypothetical protein
VICMLSKPHNKLIDYSQSPAASFKEGLKDVQTLKHSAVFTLESRSFKTTDHFRRIYSQADKLFHRVDYWKNSNA